MDESAGVTERRLRPPSLFLMLAEARGLFELNSSLALAPLLMHAPKGDGHPVLTLPGFLASDLSMAPMRRYLKALGYDARAWNMGRNLGGVASKRARLASWRLAQRRRGGGGLRRGRYRWRGRGQQRLQQRLLLWRRLRV